MEETPPIIQKKQFEWKINIFILIPFILIIAIGVYLFYTRQQSSSVLSPVTDIIKDTHLKKYAFDQLKQRQVAASPIAFLQKIEEAPDYTAYTFTYYSEGHTIGGLAHIPNGAGPFPVILQYRGFVPDDIYEPGVGTKHSAEIFAKNGYISLAPDFLGFGNSDPSSNDAMENRFQTYTTALDVLNDLPSLNQSLSTISSASADLSKVGIWGHSNGGHIALVVSEISGKPYPVVLWAPVTKPFPYSVLYYMDEASDSGKMLRKIIANFEEDYDANQYSLTNYIDWINASIELHQGTGDEAVPEKWSSDFVDTLKKHNKDIAYYMYPGDDHNFSKGNWNIVMERTINFYTASFRKEHD